MEQTTTRKLHLAMRQPTEQAQTHYFCSAYSRSARRSASLQRGDSVSCAGRAPFVLDMRMTRSAGRRQQEGVGSPRTPLPRKKIPTDLRSLARGHTALCVKVLAGIVSQEAVPAAARVAAAGILLDRGWGRPNQPHTDEDGGPLRIIIRRIGDTGSEAEPLVIEHEALKK
jgi:hypothetical protein